MPTYTALQELDIAIKNIAKKIFLAIAIVFGSITSIFLIGKSVGIFTIPFTSFIIVAVSISVMIGLIIFLTYRKRVELNYIQKFARENNFIFLKAPPDTFLKSHLFQKGDERLFSYCIQKNNLAFPFSFFEFSYGVRVHTGKKIQTLWYPYTVVAIDLPTTTPQIYIHQIQNTSLGEPFTEEQKIELHLDQEYETTHSIYAPHQYEVEVLQLLDLNFITFLKQNCSSFEIEFLNGKMYIYMPYLFSSQESYETSIKSLFSLYESLVSILEKNIRNFSFSPIGDFSLLLKRDQLLTLSSFGRIVTILKYTLITVLLSASLYVYLF